ncbi:zincin [Dentipellis sp. KUC8613]|nr:zincin [Dentipellis sp. KUC8613]
MAQDLVPVPPVETCPSIPHPDSARRCLATVAPSLPDDSDLVAFFDQPSSAPRWSSPTSTGLFGQPSFGTPAGFHDLALSTLLRAHLLTERIVRARQSRDELKKVVKNLDRLSDMLCSVIDLAELIRNSHPNQEWVESADEAYKRCCEYMNVLNTHVGLYEHAEREGTRRESRKSTGRVALPPKDLEIYRQISWTQTTCKTHYHRGSGKILILGRQFLNQASNAKPPAAIKPHELKDLKDHGLGSRLQLQTRFTQRDLLVYPGSLQAQMIMRSAPEEEPRRKVYMASNSSSPEQVEVLEALLRTRGQLAQLVGSQSFAHMTLADKMAKSSENARQFLDTLYRDYDCPPEPPAPPIVLPPLTLGVVFRGLSRLFQHLYCVSLRPADVSAEEVWHADVRKLEVFDEKDGLLGWIYSDLFARRGKSSGAAHYTVRCSRGTDDDDEAGDLLPDVEHRPLLDLSREFGAAYRHKMLDGVFQLPNGVLTLFHEMGHAMHSMIGRTEYQNVCGTRCATDFVELPSILMEHFLGSPTVLSLFDSGDNSAVRQVGNHHEDPCHNIDTHSQIMLAVLDQIYHSPEAMEPGFDSTAALARLTATRGLIPFVEGTSWQTQFGHLFGYGATYHSHLFHRAIASRVWQEVFMEDPLNRKTGKKYKREILRHGEGSLMGGDAEAMREEDEVAVPVRH